MKKKAIARLQYDLAPSDLLTVLALARAGTLQGAATRLAVDSSTIFRWLKRTERGLGQPLFQSTRRGYQPSELARELCLSAEAVEHALETARTAAQARPGRVSGRVRISTTDTILHGLVGPALAELRRLHPRLAFDLHTGNELVDVRRREADILVRATRRPPPHLVGRRLGPIRVALCASAHSSLRTIDDVRATDPPWIAPDEALPDHPSVVWRRREFPKTEPAYRVNSIQTVLELVARGLGVGIVPLFLAQGRRDVVALGPALDECQTELWLLAHRDTRHLLRVDTVYAHLASAIRLQ